MKIDKDCSKVLNINRLIAIFFVVVLHSTPSVTEKNILSYSSLDWIYSFLRCTILHVPVYVFFFISGYLTFRRRRLFIDNITNKGKTLLVPYLLWNTIWIFVFAICSFFLNNSQIHAPNFPPITDWTIRNLFDAYFGYGNISREPFLYPFWFLRDLIVLNLFVVPLQYFIYKFPIFISLCSIVLLFFNPNLGIIGANSISLFVLGGVFSSLNLQISCFKKIPFWISLLSFATSGLVELFLPNIRIFTLITTFIGVLFFFKSSWLILSSRFCGFMLSLVPYCFMIYATHEYLLSFLKLCIDLINPLINQSFVVRIFILPIVVVLLCILAGITLAKFFPSFFKILTGGR